jgi:hypothetical protein
MKFLRAHDAIALLASAATIALVLVHPASARADDTSVSGVAPGAAPALGHGHDLRLGGSVSNFGTGSAFSYRYHTAGGTALGADVRAATGSWFIDGQAADNATSAQVELLAAMPLLTRGPLTFLLETRAGARLVRGDTPMADDDTATVLGAELAPMVVYRASPDVHVRSGFRMPVWLAVAPAVELDVVGTPILAGADVRVSERVWLTADVETGSYFGYGGDGAKFLLAGMVGARWNLDTPRAPVSRIELAPAPARDRAIGAFVGTEWRAMALAGHASHGPGFQAGVTLLHGHLKLGLTGVGRPGPINPATFEAMASGGQTYKGKSTLSLRSDGNYIGLFVAPVLDVPGVPWLRVELPMSVGQAAYGFYLSGDDRETPDGRRVSAWENELLDGRDSSFAVGAEVGVQVTARLPSVPGMEPYLAAHWAFTLGYDAYVTDDYGGPSVALGMQLRL